MWRFVLSLFLGILASTLALSALAVYAFHDVDAEMFGKWDVAFVELVLEFLLFSIAITLGSGVLTYLGRFIFCRRSLAPTQKLGLLVGAIIGIVQYPFETVVRLVADEHYDFWSYAYILRSIIVSSVVFTIFCARQGTSSS